MSNEEFTGGSIYINGGEDEPLDWNDGDDPEFATATGGDDVVAPKKCSRTLDYFLAACCAVLLVLFILALTDKGGLDRMGAKTTKKDKLTVTMVEDEEKERLKAKAKENITVTVTDDEKFTVDGQYSPEQSQSEASIRNRHEVYGRMNNVSRDPAVQKVVGSYSDFKNANSDRLASVPGQQRRKGMNQADAGSNRFAGSETHANQEGSLWQKPVEQGSFVERMSAGSHNKWTGRFSEAYLDPNREYVENNAVGQPMYSWGLSPARGPRGKTDMLLEAASHGL